MRFTMTAPQSTPLSHDDVQNLVGQTPKVTGQPERATVISATVDSENNMVLVLEVPDDSKAAQILKVQPETGTYSIGYTP